MPVGADVNCVDDWGWAPMHFAAYFNYPWTVKSLKNAGRLATYAHTYKSITLGLPLPVKYPRSITAKMYFKYNMDRLSQTELWFLNKNNRGL